MKLNNRNGDRFVGWLKCAFYICFIELETTASNTSLWCRSWQLPCTWCSTARWQPRERKGKVVPITIANSLALAVTVSASASWFGYWLALIASRAPEENQPRRRSDARVPRRCRKLLLGACANKSSFGSRSSLVTFRSRDNHEEDSRSLWWKNTGGGWKFACDNCRFQRKGRVVNRAV